MFGLEWKDIVKYLLEPIGIWLLHSGVKIAIIIVAIFVTIKLSKLACNRVVKFFDDDDPTTRNERERRADTLGQIAYTTIKVIIIAIGIVMILTEFGLNIGPILAGAGIVGLAIGFGAQTLVRDVITGFFILLENQVRVGDVISIGDSTGIVEKVNLRTITLRDIEGNLHIIPNGEIKCVKNMTYLWSRALIDIPVSYKENIEEVINQLKEVLEIIKNDEFIKENLLEDPSLLGVERIRENALDIRILFKTVPLKQWEVKRAALKIIKTEFDKRNIEIPLPYRVIIQKNESNK